MVNIEEQLISVPQRENSGEDADDAFAFQKNWALSELLDRQLLREDYLYLFEYHDDVLFLDSETPKAVEFIQIKKSDRTTWTISRLTKPPKEFSNSILGKLFLHLSDFQSDVITLRFVSDMFFSFSTEKSFIASSIKEEDQKKICAQIESEIPSLRPLPLGKLTFEQCDLSFDGHADQLMGQIVRFIESTFGKSSKVRPSSFYDTLQRKAERSRNFADKPSTFHELVHRKGIGKTEIDRLILELRTSEESMVDWGDISEYVDQLVTSNRDRLIYKGIFRKIDSDRRVNGSEVLLRAFNEARLGLLESEVRDTAEAICWNVADRLAKSVPEIARSFTTAEMSLIAIIAYAELLISGDGGRS